MSDAYRHTHTHTRARSLRSGGSVVRRMTGRHVGVAFFFSLSVPYFFFGFFFFFFPYRYYLFSPRPLPRRRTIVFTARGRQRRTARRRRRPSSSTGRGRKIKTRFLSYSPPVTADRLEILLSALFFSFLFFSRVRGERFSSPYRFLFSTIVVFVGFVINYYIFKTERDQVVVRVAYIIYIPASCALRLSQTKGQ